MVEPATAAPKVAPKTRSERRQQDDGQRVGALQQHRGEQATPAARAMPTNVAGITGQPSVAWRRVGRGCAARRRRGCGPVARCAAGTRSAISATPPCELLLRDQRRRAVVADRREQLVEGLGDDVLGAVDEVDDGVGVGLDALDGSGSTEKCSPLRQVTAITERSFRSGGVADPDGAPSGVLLPSAVRSPDRSTFTRSGAGSAQVRASRPRRQ